VSGRGLATTAVALVCDHAFGAAGLYRLQADIRPENLPSQRLVERLGFRQEGVLRRYLDIDGDWRDHLSYALLAEDAPGGVLARWQSRAAGSY
jgi:[ribosomal protein S5]-alanine N-acetyltransferase